MRYFASIVAGLLIACGLYTVLFILSVGRGGSDNVLFLKEWYRQKEAILERAASPRLLIVGGSNGLYGIRASQIKEALRINAVNFATHGALSLDYLLYKVREEARSGDIVLLALEYEFYVEQPINTVFSEYVLGGDPGYLSSLPWRERAGWFMSASMERMAERLAATGTRHRRESARVEREVGNGLNASGDYTLNPSASQQEHQKKAVGEAVPMPNAMRWGRLKNPEAWKEIDAFAKWCSAHGIAVLATFPSVIYFPIYDEDLTQRTGYRLLEKYHSVGIETLGSPRDFMFPRSDFFDSVYHLNAEAAQRRTDQLIGLLRPYLRKNGAKPEEAHSKVLSNSPGE